MSGGNRTKRYFVIQTGLRGCYMPDSSYAVDVTTRRELKSVIEIEAGMIREADYIGLSKRNVAAFAARVWRERSTSKLPYALPYRRKDQDHYPYAIFAARIDRREYLQLNNQEDN